MSDFLRDRQQFVNIGFARSKIVSIPCGIIQGRLDIGPLLFVIFINDLPYVIRTAVAMSYVYDLKLSKDINCIDNRPELQADTVAVLECSKEWLLPFSIEKLSYLHIGNRFTDYIYVCNTFEIKVSSCLKNLGVTITNCLNFRSHYEVLGKKG